MIELTVEKMKCGGCAANVERAVKAQDEIGRATCRERVEIWGGAGALKKRPYDRPAKLRRKHD